MQGKLRPRQLRNWLHSIALIGGMGVLLIAIGWLIGGAAGLLSGGLLLVFFVIVSPHASPALILKMYRARRLYVKEAPGLIAVIHALAQAAHLPRQPNIYYIPSSAMNAFSAGVRRKPAIAVTDGLLHGLSKRELIAVLAHEVGHIKHNDIWILSQADGVSRVIGIMSVVGLLSVLVSLPQLAIDQRPFPWLPILLLIAAPSLSALMQLSLSRHREFDADAAAVELTGDPAGLASALDKLVGRYTSLWRRILIPWHRSAHPSLLRSHPRSSERIKRLMAMGPSDRSSIAEPEVWIRGGGGLTPVMDPPRRRWSGLWY